MDSSQQDSKASSNSYSYFYRPGTVGPMSDMDSFSVEYGMNEMME